MTRLLVFHALHYYLDGLFTKPTTSSGPVFFICRVSRRGLALYHLYRKFFLAHRELPLFFHHHLLLCHRRRCAVFFRTVSMWIAEQEWTYLYFGWELNYVVVVVFTAPVTGDERVSVSSCVESFRLCHHHVSPSAKKKEAYDSLYEKNKKVGHKETK